MQWERRLRMSSDLRKVDSGSPLLAIPVSDQSTSDMFYVKFVSKDLEHHYPHLYYDIMD